MQTLLKHMILQGQLSNQGVPLLILITHTRNFADVGFSEDIPHQSHPTCYQ